MTANAAATARPPAREISIDFWHIFTDSRTETLKDIITRFGQQNPGVIVAPKVYPDYAAILEGVQASIPANRPPALALTGYPLLKYAAANLPHPSIDDLARRDADENGMAWLTKTFAPNTLELGQVDGVTHGLPLSITTSCIFYNPGLFQQAGIERPPATWSELRDYAGRIKERTGVTGVYVQEGDFWLDQTLIESNGGRVLTGTGANARAALDTPEAIEAMQLWADMVLKDKSAAHLSYRQGPPTFASGQIGMYVSPTGQRATIASSAKFTLGVAATPSFAGKPRRLAAGGNALFVFASDPATQAATWKFLKFLYSPENATLWVKASGSLPAPQGLVDDPRYLQSYFASDALLRVAAEQFRDVVPWVSWPGKNGLQASQELVDTRDRILTGQQDVPTALRRANQEVNRLIQG